MSIWLMTHARVESWLYTGVFMVLGGVLYLFTRGKPNKHSD